MRTCILLTFGFLGLLPMGAAIPTTNDAFVYVTDDSGNDIAVYVAWPQEQGDSRYAGENDEATPIVVSVPGGSDKGASAFPVSGDAGFAEWGMISVHFLFPGGTDGTHTSTGTFDYRGADCIEALSAVIEYATGQKNDTSGDSILALIADSHASWTQNDVDTDNVGLVGYSNGGNISIITMAREGSSWQTQPAWYVGWENPVGSHYQVVDIGAKTGPMNPTYVPNSCDYTGCSLDYTDLAVAGPHVYLEDGTPGYGGTEFTFTTYQGGLGGSVDHYSREVRAALAAIPLTPPPGTANLIQTHQFWDWREASAAYGAYANYWYAAVDVIPDLKVMLTAKQTDHVQGAEDHPHVKVQADEWYYAGVSWARVNPDESYIEDLSDLAYVNYPGSPFPCNEPTIMVSGRTHELSGTGVWPWSWFEDGNTVYVGLLGNSCHNAKVVAPAAVSEMADRTHDNNWTSNLSAILYDY